MGELVNMFNQAIPQPQQQQNEESVVLIRFAGPNSTLMEIRYNNVSPLQAIAAAWALEHEAENTIKAQREEAEKARDLSKIAVPNRG